MKIECCFAAVHRGGDLTGRGGRRKPSRQVWMKPLSPSWAGGVSHRWPLLAVESLPYCHRMYSWKCFLREELQLVTIRLLPFFHPSNQGIGGLHLSSTCTNLRNVFEESRLFRVCLSYLTNPLPLPLHHSSTAVHGYLEEEGLRWATVRPDFSSLVISFSVAWIV